MELKDLFIRYRIPDQIIYIGDEQVDLYNVSRRLSEKKGTYSKETGERLFPERIKNDILEVNTGVILNSGYFVFNLLSFERIPFNKKQKDELVNWRVQKVFPENIDNYYHEYFQFDSETVLSVLIKKNIKSAVESEIRNMGLKLTYLGSSIIEIVNNLSSAKNIPDFIIESDGNLMFSVFFRNGIPIYIRKMRAGRGIDPQSELIKTVDYVKKNYGSSPRYLSLFSKDNNENLKKELSGIKFFYVPYEQSDRMFLPGIK